MKIAPFAVLAMLMFVSASCSRPQPPVMSVPAGWKEVRAADRFSLYAPPGTVFQPQQGLDSFVGRFAGNGFRINFDYGHYSNNLQGETTDPAYRVEHFGVGGQLALFVIGPSRQQNDCEKGKEIAALYVRGRDANSLMISACMDNVAQTEIIRSMFRTIRFMR